MGEIKAEGGSWLIEGRPREERLGVRPDVDRVDVETRDLDD